MLSELTSAVEASPGSRPCDPIWWTNVHAFDASTEICRPFDTSAAERYLENAYDANVNLTNVTQNAQGSSQQTRTYVYDDLSRMTLETNRETAGISYAYDSDSTCENSSGDLVKTIDAVGTTTCYSYDAMHRNTSETYSGPYASVTPQNYFVYDAATVNNVPMANPKNRLAEAYTCFSPCTSKITDLGLSFTVRGEVSDLYESTPHSGGYLHTQASYWANGVLDSLAMIGGNGYGTSYNLDGEGRVNSTSNGNLTSASYNIAGQPTQLIFGSNDNDQSYYSPSGRMQQYQFHVGTLHQVMTGTLTWNTNGTLQNLNIQDLANFTATQSCNYQHDDLIRIKSVNCPGNQLQNSGFENGNVDWNLGSSFSIVNNPTNAQSGSWYLSGSSTVATQTVATVNGTNWVPVTAGQLITYGGFIKRVSGTGSLDFSCLIVDPNYNFVAWCGSAGLGDGSGGTNWQLYSDQLTVPTNGAYVKFYAEIHCCGESDTSLTGGYFDSAFMDGVPIWSQNFSYDAFGNINKSGTSSFNPTYSSSTNQMTQIGSSTPTYDADGNVTNDFLHTYLWDSNGRPVAIDGNGTTSGIGITYDALGRMVEQNRSGTYTQIEYAPPGWKMQLITGGTYTGFVPLPGGAMAVWAGSGPHYRHPDWLGTTRLSSTSTQTVYGDVSYGPFGETYAQSGSVDFSFTGMNQDVEQSANPATLYDFPAREYGVQGRWPSPDPAGLAAGDTSNPQSWNRYAYVLNNPLALVDPSGLGPQECDEEPNPADCDPFLGGSGDGSGDGSSGPCPTDTCITVSAPPLDSPALNFAQFAYDLRDTGFVISTIVTEWLHTWFVPSPAFVGPDVTPATDQQRLMAVKVAGMRASHDLGCAAIPGAGLVAGSAAFKLGQPVAGSKPFTTPGSSVGTSPASEALREAFPQTVSRGIPTPVGGLGTGTPLRMAQTTSVGAAAGRWLPFVGLAVTAYSGYKMNQCLNSGP